MRPQVINQPPLERVSERDGLSCEAIGPTNSIHADPVHTLILVSRHSSNEPTALNRGGLNLEHQLLALLPSAVVRGPQALAEAGLIELDKDPLDLAVCGFKSEVKHLGDVRCFAHSHEWRRILTASKALVNSGSDEHPLPRMTGASALAELLLMQIDLSPPVEAINFKALCPVQKIQFRRMTGMLHAGPLPEAYQHFRHRHLVARRSRIK